MNIHVVQPGDNLNSIASQYNISVNRIIQDNGLENPNTLVVGQSIVIATNFLMDESCPIYDNKIKRMDNEQLREIIIFYLNTDLINLIFLAE